MLPEYVYCEAEYKRHPFSNRTHIRACFCTKTLCGLSADDDFGEVGEQYEKIVDGFPICGHCVKTLNAIRIVCAKPNAEGDEVIHGKTCVKVPHVRDGSLHGEDDDSPFWDDGVKYCGRCHIYLGTSRGEGE